MTSGDGIYCMCAASMPTRCTSQSNSKQYTSVSIGGRTRLSNSALSVSEPHSLQTSWTQRGCKIAAPQPYTPLSRFRDFLANRAAMFLGLRKPLQSSHTSARIVSDNPILYHMMSLDPNCPKFDSLLSDFLQSRTELKNLKKAEDDRVLKLADFLYGVRIANHLLYLTHVRRY